MDPPIILNLETGWGGVSTAALQGTTRRVDGTNMLSEIARPWVVESVVGDDGSGDDDDSARRPKGRRPTRLPEVS